MFMKLYFSILASVLLFGILTTTGFACSKDKDCSKNEVCGSDKKCHQKEISYQDQVNQPEALVLP